jgi:FAD/FMN-containing dehydrogenase
MPAQPPIRGPFRTDERARAAYAEGAGIYRIVPRAACVPADVEDLVALVRWAADERVPLVPRGAGSAMGGGNVGEGVVVDLSAMAGPGVEIAPGARRARMRAGASLGELEAAAARHGLRLPPDPSSWRWATAGGVVSTNAAGARSARYGGVRAWVEGLEIVTADGERAALARSQPDQPAAALARFAREAAPAIRQSAALVDTRFPKVRKNSSGYALDAWLRSGSAVDLIVGAEGTLGFVTAVDWRLDGIPAHRAGLRILIDDYAALADLVARMLAVDATSIELLDRTFLDLIGDRAEAALVRQSGTEAVLLVELEDDDAVSLRARVEAAIAGARPLARAVDAALSPAGAEQLWRLRHAASPILASLPPDRRSMQVIEDACVPVPRLGDYVAAVRAAARERSLEVVIFGHAGDGNVHVNLLPELARPDWERQVAGLLEAVTDAVIRLGGVPSGEHGDGRLRAGFLERVYGPEIVGLFRRLKASFDPLGILNPGIILPSGEPPIARLKAGAGAAPLPTDIAAALRDIERTGGYATPRLTIADGTHVKR